MHGIFKDSKWKVSKPSHPIANKLQSYHANYSWPWVKDQQYTKKRIKVRDQDQDQPTQDQDRGQDRILRDHITHHWLYHYHSSHGRLVTVTAYCESCTSRHQQSIDRAASQDVFSGPRFLVTFALPFHGLLFSSFINVVFARLSPLASSASAYPRFRVLQDYEDAVW